MKFGLNDSQFNLLLKLVVQPLKDKGASVWIFGSRARGDFNSFSDVDILYELDKGSGLPLAYAGQIRETVEESSLPFKIDLVSLADLADSYRKNVLRDRVLL